MNAGRSSGLRLLTRGPGPLVSNLGKTVANFPIPVAIVPGHLADEELDALS